MDNWLLIAGMLVITFATRYSLFAFPDLRFPTLVRQGLHYVPTAVLTAIVVPGMLLPDGQQMPGERSKHNSPQPGPKVGIVQAQLPVLATIGGGFLLFFLLRWATGQLPL